MNYYAENLSFLSPLIKVSLKAHDDSIRLTVENQGAQIASELGEKIWTEAFTTSPDGKENTGLGLFIVKEISLMEHTKCGFDNTDRGVRFWFDFIDRFAESEQDV